MSREDRLSTSIKARLQNKARAEKRPFNDLLQLYGIERFLYRLSCSPFQKQFVLKGALMLLALEIPSMRPTRDIDLLGRTSNDLVQVTQVFRQICQQRVEPDGLRFDPASIKATRIKEDADYEGVRMQLRTYLGSARIPLQIDIGFADVLTPAAMEIQYPTLLSLPAPVLRGYPLETIVAEKLQAMVFLGSVNSRMKDFYDLWVLLSHFEIDAPILQRAIRRTFQHRQTPIPVEVPMAFSDAFVQAKQAQWQAFVARSRLEGSTPEFAEVVQVLRAALMPILRKVGE